MDTTRIYIVEDEALIVMELVDRLMRLGYQVCGKAARGEQALEDIPRTNPDIVLMDICLAGELDGIETAARLRRLLNVPIVFLSAFSDAQLIEEAIGNGTFGYLLKPFEERELSATLQAALAKHRLERTLQEANATLDETVRARTAALTQSEGQLRDLFDGTSDLIQSVAPDGRLLFVNRAWRETLGYSADEVAVLNVFDVIQAECRDHYRGFLQQILAGEKVGLVEILFRTKNGRAVVAEGQVSLRVENGRPVATRGIFRDITEQKASEETVRTLNRSLERLVTERTGELRESEERLRTLFEQAAVGVAEIDTTTGRFIRVNRKYGEIVGYSMEQMLALDFMSITHPDDLASDLAQMERLKRGELREFTLEKRYIRKDGSIVWVELTVSPLQAGNEALTRHLAVVKDITERKQVESQLRLTQFAVEHAADAVLWADDTKRFVYVNEAACRSLGYTREELLTLRIPDITPQHDPERFQQRLTSIKQGRSATYESLHRRKDGTEFPVEASIAYLEHEGRGYTCGIVRDITERKRAEEALAEKTNELSDFIEHATVSMHWVGADGIILWANQTELDLLGYSREEYIGHHIADFHVDQPIIQKLLDCLSCGETVQECAARLRSKDGSIKDVLIDSSVLRKNGTFIHTRCFTRDITERKQAEAALQAFQDQIRQMQKMEAIGQLAGGVAHDFNNILTAILGNAEMAAMKTAAGHPVQPNLTRIIEAGNRASHLVQQILTFTHQQEFSRTALDLAPVIYEALALLRATLPAGIELTATYDAATPHVLADATQVHQVLMNLCTNAWHALNEQPGSIAVNLTPVMLAHPLHSLHVILPPGRYARLSVRDTGCGMEPETVERIFDPFFTTKPVGQGTGLGLSVVHGIVRGHEGAIVVDSRPNQSTTFHLYFPAVDAPAHPRESAGTTPAQRQGRNRHLLYLDDEEMLVELIRAKFEPLGYRVTGCTKPAEAIDAVRADPSGFDVVVTDYNMPGMSGLDVASALAHLRADLPVVVVSGYLSPTAQAAILAAGIKEIVYKPTLLQQLGDVIARLTVTPPQQ
ncbi:MAG: PAS domain S-box protein [Nitrospirae bacterium]|nr:PAS domain S-box protein [Nitrospirota bacterium]